VIRSEAEEYVRTCLEDEGPDSYEEAAEIFAALYDRRPGSDDGDQGAVWSLCCAAVPPVAEPSHDVEVDDQVEMGAYGTDDHDVGTVTSVDGDSATVRWSGGNETEVDAHDLDYPPGCARCGRQHYHLGQCSRCGLADQRAKG
jgi:hypothetical protein